ncbi:MAG: cytochrome P450 [Chloroflexi bacterium]|nr:cytochrome P450 [Chloroflexota bacterium]
MTQEQPQSRVGFFDNPAVAADPYPFFAGMRQNTPVAQFGPLGLWIVSRYDDVTRILHDHETFSSAVGARRAAGEKRPPSILFDDPPVHTRMRALLTRAFTPRTIELQRPSIVENCARMIDDMCAKKTADFVAELAYPLPVMVIAAMLGVQDGDMATFKRWSDAIIENLGASLLSGDNSALEEVNKEFDAYFSERLDKLRREPEDNLLSALVHADGENGKLSQEDLLVVCRVLLVAGNETTTGLIVNTARAFSEYPEQMRRVKEDLDLVPSAVEEVLRFYSPFPATFRQATRDVEVAGVTIPKDAQVLPLLASANRDETQFERAAEFLIDRDPNRHVAFGMGIHYCLGAPLARLEGGIVMRTLLPRIKRIQLMDAEAGNMLRAGGPKSLLVRFDLERAPAAV